MLIVKCEISFEKIRKNILFSGTTKPMKIFSASKRLKTVHFKKPYHR